MSNYLITKSGKTIECTGGAEHAIICKRELDISLNDFLLKHNGVRVMVGRNETLAIEYYKTPSIAQVRIIHKILRADDYYTVILQNSSLDFRLIKKFRPIRSFQV